MAIYYKNNIYPLSIQHVAILNSPSPTNGSTIESGLAMPIILKLDPAESCARTPRPLPQTVHFCPLPRAKSCLRLFRPWFVDLKSLQECYKHNKPTYNE